MALPQQAKTVARSPESSLILVSFLAHCGAGSLDNEGFLGEMDFGRVHDARRFKSVTSSQISIKNISSPWSPISVDLLFRLFVLTKGWNLNPMS